MSYSDCPKCGKFVWSGDNHECPPVFHVWCPEYGHTPDDAKTFCAHGPAGAAEQWAEKSDRDSVEYLIVGGSDVEVCVRRESTGEVIRMRVWGESVPSYTARVVVDTARGGEGQR